MRLTLIADLFPNSNVGHLAAWTFSVAAVTALLGLFAFVGKTWERRKGPSATFTFDLWKMWVPLGAVVTTVLLLATVVVWVS